MPFFGNPPNGQLQKKALINQKVTKLFLVQSAYFYPFFAFCKFQFANLCFKIGWRFGGLTKR
jgi:hypothetical protein